MAYLFVLLAVAVVAAAGGAGILRHRRRNDSSAQGPVPRSLVRVLTSDDELRAAVGRAARFERMLADSVQTRTRRYEAMVAPAAIPHLDTDPVTRSRLSDGRAPRSA